MEEDSYALSGITVTAQKVPVEMKAGKTVYNLSATISGTQGNLYDALRQMPGVQIQSNGNILLDGQGGINVNADKLLAKYPGVDSGENRTDKQSVLPSRCSRKNGSDKH